MASEQFSSFSCSVYPRFGTMMFRSQFQRNQQTTAAWPLSLIKPLPAPSLPSRKILFLMATRNTSMIVSLVLLVTRPLSLRTLLASHTIRSQVDVSLNRAQQKLRGRLAHAVLETFAGVALVVSTLLVPKAKRVLTLRSTNVSLALNPIQRSAFILWVKPMHSVAHRIIAISRFLKERAVEFGRNDVVVIPNGLHITDIPHAQKVPGRILFAGRLRPMKGIDTLLRAFARLCAAHCYWGK